MRRPRIPLRLRQLFNVGLPIATRAVTAFLGLEEERPLYAYVAKHNVASLRVLEKCGFTLHGEGIAPGKEGDPEVEEFVLILGPDARP